MGRLDADGDSSTLGTRAGMFVALWGFPSVFVVEKALRFLILLWDRYKRSDFKGDALLVGWSEPRMQEFRKSVGVSPPDFSFHTRTSTGVEFSISFPGRFNVFAPRLLHLPVLEIDPPNPRE